jgi:hypothetical protein
MRQRNYREAAQPKRIGRYLSQLRPESPVAEIFPFLYIYISSVHRSFSRMQSRSTVLYCTFRTPVNMPFPLNRRRHHRGLDTDMIHVLEMVLQRGREPHRCQANIGTFLALRDGFPFGCEFGDVGWEAVVMGLFFL